MKLIFDIETDGLMSSVTKVHCIVIKNIETNKIYSFKYDEIDKALKLLSDATLLVGHNILKFDIQIIKKLYPDFKYKVNGLNYNDVMGYPKYKIVLHEEAEKIKNPGFLKSYFGLAEYESLLVPARDPEALGEGWDYVNNETSSKKTTSTKNNNNLSDELEKLKKLYKDGTLSKEEFAKAKKKLLK